MVLKHPILTSPWNNWRGTRMLRDGRWSLPWLHPHDNALPQQMPISPLLVHPLCTHALNTGTPHPHSFPWELWCPLCDHEGNEWTESLTGELREDMLVLLSLSSEHAYMLVCSSCASLLWIQWQGVASQGSTGYLNSALMPLLHLWENTAHKKRPWEKVTKGWTIPRWG